MRLKNDAESNNEGEPPRPYKLCVYSTFYNQLRKQISLHRNLPPTTTTTSKQTKQNNPTRKTSLKHEATEKVVQHLPQQQHVDKTRQESEKKMTQQCASQVQYLSKTKRYARHYCQDRTGSHSNRIPQPQELFFFNVHNQTTKHHYVQGIPTLTTTNTTKS